MEIKEIRLKNLVIPNNIFMAPLAGYTWYPLRMLCRELGAGLCFMEMVSCTALYKGDRLAQKTIFTTGDEKIKAAQLLVSDCNVAGKIASSEHFAEFDILDLNMGCPVPNVFKSGEGSALLGDIKRASRIIRAVKAGGKITTVKFRVGLNENKLIGPEFARMCEDSGADLISIHGRSRNMMYDGRPFYDQIEQAKSVVNIPVIANGAINSRADAEMVMRRTGADGIMLGRYALENPFIFSELSGQKTGKNKYDLLMSQIELARRFYDETITLEYIRRLASQCMKKIAGTKQYKIDLYRAGNITELQQAIYHIFDQTNRNG